MKSMVLTLLAVAVITLSSCATTSGCETSSDIYQKSYNQALANGQSEKTANVVAKNACRAHQMGEWARK